MQLAVAALAALCAVVAAQTPASYYGLPLGSIFYSSSATQGEVYVSDARTLTIVNFQHAGEPGCTSFMVGPPKPGVENGVSPNKDGVIVSAKRLPAQRRRRQADELVPQIQPLNPNRHPLDWAFEFGHLRADDPTPGLAGAAAPKQAQDPFDVQLDDEKELNETAPTAGVPSETTPAAAASSAQPALSATDDQTPAAPLTTSGTTQAASEVNGSAPARSPPAAKAARPSVILRSSVEQAPIAVVSYDDDDSEQAALEKAVESFGGSAENLSKAPLAPSTSSSASSAASSAAIVTVSSSSDAADVLDEEESVTPPPERKAIWNRPAATGADADAEDPFESVVQATAADAAAAADAETTAAAAAATTERHRTRGNGIAVTAAPVRTNIVDEKRADREGATVIKLGGGSGEKKSEESATKSPSVGGGINWGDRPSARQEQPIDRADATVVQLGGRQNSETEETGETKRPVSALRNLPVEYFAGLNIPDELEGKNSSNPQFQGGAEQRGPEGPTTRSFTIVFGDASKQIAGATPEPLKTYRGLPLPPSGPAPPAAGPPGAAAEIKPLLEAGTVDETLENAENATECRDGWCVVPDPHRRKQVPASELPAEAATTASPSVNDTGFYYVDDRHAQYRAVQQQIQQQPQPGPAQIIATNVPEQSIEGSATDNPTFTASPGVIDPASARYEPPQLPETQDGQLQILPRFSGETVQVKLPEPYVLSDFQWFGIYDHCKRVRTATINVRGVQIPQVTTLPGIRGWQYDVSSGSVNILNCNTILLTNFTYSGAGKTEAFIYVGNGEFPHSINQKARAYVVGTFPDRSLKNFNNEDALVRLPPGWKTFDSTWISIFNPKGNVSYGHALIPPVVVPPCEDQ